MEGKRGEQHISEMRCRAPGSVEHFLGERTLPAETLHSLSKATRYTRKEGLEEDGKGRTGRKGGKVGRTPLSLTTQPPTHSLLDLVFSALLAAER
ncbi:hypothetical protein R1flu_010031 [Riccia fluitans]|uniref:Uncharacterized protein n=1 Tax=Riccia fluitans TaxID=41844 RepID=A0ABD1Z4Y1_9MARC